jgi:hypothetical protein
MTRRENGINSAQRLPPGSVGEELFRKGIADPLHIEKHYSVGELANLWCLSEKTIRRMFENEPGVLCWGQSEGRHRRGYKTLRIPESVMLRVHRQLRVAG